MRRQIGARLREQLDVADDRHARRARRRGERVRVERHPGGDDQGVEAAEVERGEVGDRQILLSSGEDLVAQIGRAHV